MTKPFYTTQLQAGLGLVDESKLLLSLYQKELPANQLYEKALDSGLFPMVSARRLRNIVVECFSPRYIKSRCRRVSKTTGDQHVVIGNQSVIFGLYRQTANEILQDFIQEIYWDRYSGGRDSISTDDAKDFVVHAVREE